jgi:type III restriction enzyme
MAEAVISYDKDLPEIPNHCSFLEPDRFLRKKPGKNEEFEIVEGRRPSRLILVNQLRSAVREWRNAGYPDASNATQRLLKYWFVEDHLVNGSLWRYYFGQREAIETLIYLTEIEKNADIADLIAAFGEIFYPDGTQKRLEGKELEIKTAVDGKRRLLRYVPEVESEQTQDLPVNGLRRYAFKMATGSGKTVVMAMAIIWSYFHRKLTQGSDLATNFLVLAPNVIVYQRLEKDFANKEIFNQLPLIPPEWRSRWNMKVILRDDANEPDPSGTLFLTNIQQIYASRSAEWKPANPIERILGRAPVKDLSSHQRPMLDRIKSCPNLCVLNDEAHHVHDEDLEWHKTLMEIRESVANGLSHWLDFSATPKDQNGTYFPWILCDYPLAQAVEDRIVKAPLIVHRVNRDDPKDITKESVVEAYQDWLLAALARWQVHYDAYKPLGQKPVLFIMAEKNVFADAIGQWLVDTEEIGLKKSEVLVIHTDKDGDVRKGDLETARKAARDIDTAGNKVKIIVSVLMLREGWDVKNVTVTLGLRPFSAESNILPEQAIGRGLRLMQGIGPDRTQTLEVIGTKRFEDIVRELEKEGVGIKTTSTPPAMSVKIFPVYSKSGFDIAFPQTKPIYLRNYTRIEDFDPSALGPIYDQENILNEPIRIHLKMEFATTETEVHQADIGTGPLPLAQDIIASICNKVMREANLSGIFDRLYPLVRQYLHERCFGKTVDLDEERIRDHLRSVITQNAIAKLLAEHIGELTTEMKPIEFERKGIKLSDAKTFTWRRNLPPLECEKTIFNYVATYNNYERQFAQFLDDLSDVVRFASLGTTESESGVAFKIDYLKPSGAIGFYYPDFVAVQTVDGEKIHWIIETKGRIWEDTNVKDGAMEHWCEMVTESTGQKWRFIRVNQSDFGLKRDRWSSFADMLRDLAAHADDGPLAG